MHWSPEAKKNPTFPYGRKVFLSPLVHASLAKFSIWRCDGMFNVREKNRYRLTQHYSRASSFTIFCFVEFPQFQALFCGEPAEREMETRVKNRHDDDVELGKQWREGKKFHLIWFPFSLSFDSRNAEISFVAESLVSKLQRQNRVIFLNENNGVVNKTSAANIIDCVLAAAYK